MAYPFLVLSLLLLIPGAVVFIARRDLRRVMVRMGLCAVPFAFTETLFYPSYWEPCFLFDLVRKIGFGIEDLLFVGGLAAFTTTAYPFLFRRRFAPLPNDSKRAKAFRVGGLIGAALLLTALAALAGVPAIYASVAVMLGIAAVIGLWRRDLAVPSLLGGLLSLGIYGALCLLLDRLIPGVFALDWHTDRFLNRFVLGIPVEELLYSGAAGAVATAFYPFAFFEVFTPIGQERASNP